MVLPAHFEERRPGVLHQLIESHRFGLLITPQRRDGSGAVRFGCAGAPVALPGAPA